MKEERRESKEWKWKSVRIVTVELCSGEYGEKGGEGNREKRGSRHVWKLQRRK